MFLSGCPVDNKAFFILFPGLCHTLYVMLHAQNICKETDNKYGTNNKDTLSVYDRCFHTPIKKVPLMCLQVLSIGYQISPEIRQDNQAW